MLTTAFILFIFGAAIGSFLNVLIDRLPNEESIMGRSHCDHCKRQLPAVVNIPLFSWYLLRGKTACCNERLSFQYPFVEFLTAVVFVVGGLYEPISLISRVGLIGLMSTCIVILFADAKYHIIPDSMQFLFLVFSLIYLIGNGRVVSWQMGLDGLVVMAPILFLFLVTLGRGIGFGDVKFAFSMGVLLGMWGGLLALYIAFIIGAIIGVLVILKHRKGMKSAIAFGPFLLIGTLLVLFFPSPFFAVATRIFSL